MEIKFDVKMTRNIMYDFLIHHTYRSMSGVIGVIFGLSAIVLSVFTFGKVDTWQSVAYLLFGIWFTLYLPVNLYMRSARQIKSNPVFRNPVTYILNEEGITSMQGDQKVLVTWKDLFKVRETKMSLLIYTGARYSFILPKTDMGDSYGEVVNLIRKHMKDKQIKIKARQ